MAFKHNLPLPVLIVGIVVAGLVGLLLFHSPPDEDLLKQAIDAHVATLGPIKDMQIRGNVVDLIAGENNQLIFALFEKKDGKWAYSKNLAEEFSQAMKDPEVQKTVLQHLGEKISKRFKASVTFHETLREFKYDLARDPGNEELLGSCSIKFAYPKTEGQAQRGGLYVENFEWKDGRWQSSGPGSLYDSVPPK